MRKLLERLHAKIGDLWWYSAMIFVACRSGDAINAFIGLWLVPKYVGPQELGAVLPLQQLTSFLTVPLGVVAIVFSKQVNTYAAHGEYGKVKGFIRDVLAISAVLFVVCIALAYLIMPFFYERLKIASGLLTALILASGFVGSIGSLVGAAQQGLKRFKMMTWMNLIGSPIRLVTMLVAMPIRALSGYILGQTTPGVVTTTLAALDTKKALAPYAPDTSWRKDWKSILGYTWKLAAFTVVGLIIGTAQTTIYRQRLPEIESAANYMLSRFAEVATYCGLSLSVILFPLAAESYEKGRENIRLLKHTLVGIAVPTIALSVFFMFSAKWIFSLTKTWSAYLPYADLLALLTLITGTASAIGTIISYEMACRRFGIAAFVNGFNILFVTFLATFTGCEFFRGILPDAVVTFMANCHVASIRTILYVSIPAAIIQIAYIWIVYARRARHNELNGGNKCHPS